MSKTHYIQRLFTPDTSPEEAELIQMYNDFFRQHNITFQQYLNTRLYPNSATSIAILEIVFNDDLESTTIINSDDVTQDRPEI